MVAVEIYKPVPPVFILFIGLMHLKAILFIKRIVIPYNHQRYSKHFSLNFKILIELYCKWQEVVPYHLRRK